MTDRIPLDHLTSDQLDALYDRAEEAEKQVAIDTQIMEKADTDTNGIIEAGRWFRQQAERTQAWGEQHRDRANRYRARLDRVKAECAAIVAEVYGQHDEDDDGMREAVRRIRAAYQVGADGQPVMATTKEQL